MSNPGKLTYDNFGKFRQRWIYDADRLVREADEILSNSIAGGEQAERLKRRAAKFLETAAGSFGRAGLGLQAKAAWARAGGVYADLGREEDAARCSRCARAIPDYWNEAET
jgi:hypothetical protein